MDTETHRLADPSTLAAKHASITRTIPNKTQWHTANFCRGFEGLFALVVTFALVMRSETVRDLLLNFTAVEFISNVDNLIFLLAKWRFFGRKVRESTEHPTICSEDSFTFHGPTVRFCEVLSVSSNLLLFIIIVLAFFSAWLCIAVKQGRGEYLPPSFYVQFGDVKPYTYQSFVGGLYHRQPIKSSLRFLKSGKVSYKRENSDKMRFHYCDSDAAWVFGNDNECGNWNVISSKMPQKAFALPSEDMKWFIRKSKNEMRKADKGAEMSFIRIRESVEDKNPCEFLMMDIDDLAFCGLDLHFGALQIVDGALSYGLPVYASAIENRFLILLCIGRRWALVYGYGEYVNLTAAEVGKLTAADVEMNLEAQPSSFLSQIGEVNITEPGEKSKSTTDLSFSAITHVSESFDIGSPRDLLIRMETVSTGT